MALSSGLGNVRWWRQHYKNDIVAVSYGSIQLCLDANKWENLKAINHCLLVWSLLIEALVAACSRLDLTYVCDQLFWRSLSDFSTAPNQAHELGSDPELQPPPSAGLCKQGTGSACPLWVCCAEVRCILPTALVLCTRNVCLLLACQVWPLPKPTRIFASASVGLRSGFEIPHNFVMLQFSPTTYPSFPFYSAWRPCAGKCAILPVDRWIQLPPPSLVL